MFFISPFLKAQTYDVTSTDQYGNKSKTTVKVDEKKSGLEYKEKNLNQHLNQQSNINKSLQGIDLSGMYNRQYEKSGGGIKFFGDGQYRIIELGKTGFSGKKKIRENIIKQIDNICLEEKCEYEIFKEESRKAGAGVFPEYEIHFTLKNDKNEYVTIKEFKENDKDSAKKKLLELNELKNQGIITQEEYDKAAAPHKKILLGL